MERNSKGQLVHDPKTFSSGIKALADYVHSKGLELGIYTDAGFFTCQVRAGSLYHENDDAALFASWVSLCFFFPKFPLSHSLCGNASSSFEFHHSSYLSLRVG
ncbi:Alpha-galactosidase [Forsythia ovata]|uniref:Alpha-galactosidase n=1 Tax=Forsythia ovata TaxID=205694 RepID=A0ABD1P9T2_9LAMI